MAQIGKLFTVTKCTVRWNVCFAEELDYEQVTQGLKDGSLIYLEVRNLSELQTDGKIVGSVVVPCKFTLIAYLQQV